MHMQPYLHIKITKQNLQFKNRMIRIHFPSSTAEFLQHHTALLHRRQNVTPVELAIEYQRMVATCN